ncbi:MAG: hypothetical protein V1861_03900 [Candidatus Micrarchaeota archaeon]
MIPYVRFVAVVVLILVFSQFAFASDAVIAYRSDTGVDGVTSPKIRFWNSSSTGSWGPEIELAGTGSDIRWAVIKWSNVSQKLVLVTQDDDNYLTGYVCSANCDDPSNWNVAHDIAVLSPPTPADERMFDFEFESATGDAVLVYSVLSFNASRDLGYKVLPNASSSFASLTEYYIDDTGHVILPIPYIWVSTDHDPVPSSEEIIVTAHDPLFSDTNAWIWDGSAWGNQVEITNNAISTWRFEANAVKYAVDGSKGMVVSSHTASSIPFNGFVRYRYWNGASWSSASTFDIDSGVLDFEDPIWITLKADPASDDLQAVILDDDLTTDLGTAYWNGASWTMTEDIDTGGVDIGSRRPADFEWNPSGSSGRLIWDTDGSGTTLSVRTCAPQCTSGTSTISSYAATGRWVTLYTNPTDADTVNILGVRLNNNDDLGSFIFNGASFSNYGDSIITSDADTSQFESFSIAFLGSANLSALKLDATSAQPSPGGIVGFNITLTNTGNSTLTDVGVTDTLPVGLTFASASPAADSVVGQDIGWNNVGPLAPGSSTVLYINATVDSGVVNSTVTSVNLTNCVSADAAPLSGRNVSVSDCDFATVFYASVSIIKVDMTPLPPSQGGLVQWEINISNPGEVTLDPVLVVDTLPSGFTFASASPSEDSVVGQVVTWNNVGPIAPGGSVIILLNSTADLNISNGTYSNDVSVTGVPPNGFNVTDSDTASVGISTAAINVVKTVSPTAVSINQNVTFTLNITNSGQINLSVTIVDTLPPNVSFSGSPVPPTSNSSGVVTWSALVNLTSGSSFLLQYNVTANSSGDYSNFVLVTGVPPNGANVTDNDSAFFTATPLPDDDEEEEKDTLDLSVSLECNRNIVTVTSGGPVSGAEVKVNGDSIGTTNSSGQIEFSGCGVEDVIVRASKSGYYDETIHIDLESCDCLEQCDDDSDCGSNQQCLDGQCIQVECGCGVVQNHQCVRYQCCSDTDCSADETCENHICKQKPPEGCASDIECLPTEYCDIPSAQDRGTCKNITGCGSISNHALVPYECGSESGCPACPLGQACTGHKCIAWVVSCPTTGIVGDEVTCSATVDGELCVGCVYKVTNPSGTSTGGTTDENGNFQLSLGLVGTYNVSLLSDGNPIKTIQVKALSSPESVFPEKATMDYLPYLVILLMILLILGVLWRRRRKKKELKDKKK